VENVSKKPSFKDPSSNDGPSKEEITKKLNELNAALKETKTPTANTGASAPAQADNKSRTIGHYVVGKSLGEGTFGKVRLGTHTLTGEKVAIKILEKDKISDKSDIERVTREI
jgi:serine/threonine protein kinase